MPRPPTQGAQGSDPVQRDTDQALLFKIARAVLGIEATGGIGSLGAQADLPANSPADITNASAIALLKAILNKNFTIDATNANINLNVDELEEGIGFKNNTFNVAEQDSTVDTGLIGYIRGLLKHEVTDTRLQSSVAGTLTAPSTQLDVSLAGKRIKNHVFTFTVATINTNVTIGIFGKAGSEAGSARTGEQDFVITANGRFMIKVKDTPLSEVSLRMVGESGGAAVVISDIEYLGTD